jgi:hypothetical protein
MATPMCNDLSIYLNEHDAHLRDVVHAQDGGLGRVDDGGGQHRPIHPSVADGECAARHFVNADGAVTCLACQVIHGLQQGI